GSSNKDAVWAPGDSAPASGVSASRTSAGSSSHMSSHVATSLAPCLMRVFGPQEFLLVTLPGTANTSRFCSRAQRAVMRVPLYSAVSTTRTPKGDFTDDAIGNGKILRAGESAHRKLGNQRS